MTQFRHCALALSVSFAPSFSCADDDDPKGPTQDEMQQVAADACEKGIECGTIPRDVTLEQCIENQVGAYRASSECLAVYYLDECLMTQTCEEIDRLNQLNIGECADERDETSRVHALCVP